MHISMMSYIRPLVYLAMSHIDLQKTTKGLLRY